MAENGGEPHTLDPKDPSDHPVKRKPDSDCLVESEADRRNKLPKPSAEEDNGDEVDEIDRKGKGVITAVNKGKGIMVVEDEEDDSDDEDSSSDESSGGVGVGNEDGSDFDDDPLAEVDLDNILPSRTRRRAPPAPGAYLVVDQDEDEDDDEDGDGLE
ncbi:hypothetical protein J5N97_007112 [Dioscorea zingiberensis]|uniref:Histone chaperone domain-containing protein n=1 Tax=Dioscorea zingiberensis TaxID=325984 RepID=A0A9D5HU81_9LILI|nr:hypothetical protein J5N97_007112 [Dioscorea zingiberensis]